MKNGVFRNTRGDKPVADQPTTRLIKPELEYVYPTRGLLRSRRLRYLAAQCVIFIHVYLPQPFIKSSRASSMVVVLEQQFKRFHFYPLSRGVCVLLQDQEKITV